MENYKVHVFSILPRLDRDWRFQVDNLHELWNTAADMINRGEPEQMIVYGRVWTSGSSKGFSSYISNQKNGHFEFFLYKNRQIYGHLNPRK